MGFFKEILFFRGTNKKPVNVRRFFEGFWFVSSAPGQGYAFELHRATFSHSLRTWHRGTFMGALGGLAVSLVHWVGCRGARG